MDPRLSSTLADRRLAGQGRPILKAVTRKAVKVPGPPTGRQVEAERPFWGPHPDPLVAFAEDEFYRVGHNFIRGLFSAVAGQEFRPLQKAMTPERRDGWGEVANLFKQGGEPQKLYDGWAAVIDKFAKSMLPATTVEKTAEQLALRTHLMFRLGQKFATNTLPAWGAAVKRMPNQQAASVAWTKLRAMEFLTNASADAKNAILPILINARQENASMSVLRQRLFDKASTLNRDWRRIALTETALAVSNGALASVDPAEGWEAQWLAGPNACPACKALHRTKYRVVAPDAPKKDGDKMVWAGKNNSGRSAHKWSEKDQRPRTKDELWWPCIPMHPNCACQWVMRRLK